MKYLCWIFPVLLLIFSYIHGADAITDEEKGIVSIISLIFGILSLVCSIFTLLLIYYSKKWTGYLLLLVSLTVSQIIYDFNYIFRIIQNSSMCHFTMFLDVWGGLGISFWVNILSFVVAYTVVSSKPIQIFQHYYLFSIYGTLIPAVAGIIVAADSRVLSTDDSNGNSCHYTALPEGNFFFNLYYWGRLGAIILTVIFCSITFIRLRTMRMGIMAGVGNVAIDKAKLGNNTNANTTANGGNRAESRMVFVTVSRMNYYAFAQVLCRSGAAWNEWNHGQYSTFESSIAAAICSPSTGILSFLIFMMMQPNAYKNFVRLLCCQSMNDEDRFKTNNSIVSSSKSPSLYDSRGSRISSGFRSTNGDSSIDPETQFDTPNPIFLTTFNQDDWYEDEDVILARWISQQQEDEHNKHPAVLKNDPLIHPSQRVKTSSAVYARLLNYSTESDDTFHM